jgi:tetratricopeptide (TPR) repeat protein
MLTLEERAELLVKVAELGRKKLNGELVTLLTSLSRDDLLSEPDLGLRLASRWFHFSRYSDARELVDQLSEPCRRGGFDQIYRRHRILDGSLLTEAGDLAAAEAAFQEVFQRSIAAQDQRIAAVAMSNIGATAGIRGEWSQALGALQRAITSLQSLGDSHNLGCSHHNLGIVYRELGLHGRADSHFEKASHFYAESRFDVSVNLATLAIERALAMSGAGDIPRAEATAQLGLEKIASLEAEGHHLARENGEAFMALGKIMLARQRLYEARELLERALEFARRGSSRLLEGEVCEALFELAQLQGEAIESARWFTAALDAYHILGANLRANRMLARGRNAASG